MAASTVAYTDTTGNKDYLGMIAGQIGRRLKEASDMASDERAYAEGKAGDGGTSLSEAGIGRGYFFRRALGSRFGGDAIARTKGRMGMGGAGTNPAGNFKSRFRGGFDYNVTNELSSIPLSNALTAGLRGVEGGLIDISQSLNNLARGMDDLARAQGDAAKQSILNGAFMQAFLNHMQREGARQRARSEERGLEGRLLGGGFGDGSGRGMINVTPSFGGARGASGGLKNTLDFGDVARRVTAEGFSRGAYRAGGATVKATTTAAKVLKAGGNIPKVAKNLDPLYGMTKGAKNMVNLMPGRSALKNMVGGVAKATKNPRTFEKLAKAVTVPGKINKVQKTLKNSKTAFVDLSKTLNRTGDAIDITEIGAKNPRKITKAFSAAENIVTGGPDMIKAVSTSPELMNQIKNADKVSDGLASSKVVAAAADAGAKPNLLRRFIFGTKPKGLVRGSALTRMLVKNPAGKMFLKKLPLIGAVAGTIFAAQRLLEGDFLGAGLELGSGLLGAFGAAPASLALDGFLLARDFGAVPFAKGGIVSRPTLSMMGEGNQKEGVFPLEGAEGKKTFKMFGEGVLNARTDNESDDTKLQALGHKRYYESMGGWDLFGEGLKGMFGIKDKIGEVLENVNPLSDKNLSKVNNSSAVNSIRDVIGSEKDDGYLGPKWLGIKNPFADEQANMLNNASADTSLGQMMMSTTVINNNYAVANGGNGDEGSSDSAFPSSFAAFTVPYSLASK